MSDDEAELDKLVAFLGLTGEDTNRIDNPPSLTAAQIAALKAICGRFKVPFCRADFRPVFDLPRGYVAGWVGPIYVGCAPDGAISS